MLERFTNIHSNYLTLGFTGQDFEPVAKPTVRIPWRLSQGRSRWEGPERLEQLEQLL